MFIDSLIKWSNGNTGFQSLLLFLTTIFLGWISGIFRSLKTKPKFKIEIIPGPNFCSTFEVGEQYNNYEVHQTGISLYLKVSNIGNSPASIKNIKLAFHWNIKLSNFLLWLRYKIGWDWISYPTIALIDFGYDIGKRGGVKIYPFLIQSSRISGGQADTYLSVGKNINGVVYFELDKSFGARFPAQVVKKGKKYTKLIIRIIDSFDISHQQTLEIPIVELSEARKYCPSFGTTLSTYREEQSEENPNIDYSVYKNEAEEQSRNADNLFDANNIPVEKKFNLIQLELSKIATYITMVEELCNYKNLNVENSSLECNINSILVQLEALNIMLKDIYESYFVLSQQEVDESFEDVDK